MMPSYRYFGRQCSRHKRLIVIVALWCFAQNGWTQDYYHTNRVFNKVTFTIPGVPTAFEVCNMAGQLTTVVGPTNVITNSFYATERQSVALGHVSSAQAWAAAVAGYPSNSCVHSNCFYDNAGWVKGVLQAENGEWGGYIWVMQNTVNFKTSATNVWVSMNGVTNNISKVLVGTIGDYPAMADEEDTGPGLEGLTNNPPSGGSSDNMIYTADFTAYYEINLPSLWIEPLLTNVCINSGNVNFTLSSNSRVANGVTWSLTPEGLTNGATWTGYPSNVVVDVGGIATSYVVKATAVDNTNIFGSAVLNVVQMGSPLQYKMGTNAWNDMPDPLYICKDATVNFKAIKVPANASWPSGKPVWGGLLNGLGVETNSYTFSIVSSGTTDYKIVSAECGNVVTGKVIVVGKVEMTAYRPTTEGTDYGNPFQKLSVPNAQEENPGAGIRVNGDDDNNNGTADRDDTTVSGENDLIEVILDANPPASSGFKYVLKRNNSNIKVWNSQTKGTVYLGANDETNLTFSSTPMTVWVENPSGGSADLELQVQNDSSTVIGSDKVHFYSFASVVIAIGGEDQIPTDPPNGNHGIFCIATNLYTQGYDVHMFDEDELYGNIHNEITNAIVRRAVGRVAVIGYSHGGGATHVLAETLSGENLGSWELSFTAYIDAVAEPLWFAETGRPTNSVYHINYYQPNGLLHGAPMDNPPGADFQMNVTTNSWGTSLVHTNIDDHINVKNGIIDHLKSNMNPW